LLRAGGKAGPTLIAQSPAMRPVLEVIARVGPSDANVLITGENGTAKASWPRRCTAFPCARKAFLFRSTMGGLPEGVFESELFGHVRGAFTDAKADRAGRFELARRRHAVSRRDRQHPLSQQAKILRTIV